MYIFLKNVHKLLEIALETTKWSGTYNVFGVKIESIILKKMKWSQTRMLHQGCVFQLSP
jgi:hypothetical protein